MGALLVSSGQPTVCLCMIVRNEAHVLRRALESVRGTVDHWVICDTGSSDDTAVIALQCMAGIPGELRSSAWVSFGHNRGEALRLARERADYSLVLDADMVLNVHGAFKHKLRADWYELRYEGAVDYSQPMLLSNAHAWEYVGATHEYVRSATARTAGALEELTLVHHSDGGMRADKFQRDICLLEDAHRSDPQDPRTLFYLAQSHWDSGDAASALHWYERRIEHGGGWEEELWFARLRAAEALHALEREEAEVRAAYLAAYAARPTRLEPLYALARSCRERGEFALGHMFAAAGRDTAYPNDRLFVDREAHSWRLTLERGLCAYGLGRSEEAIRAFNSVLDSGGVPDWAVDGAIGGLRGVLERTRGRAATAQEPNRIKVLVAFRNPGHFLDNCVESLLAQDYEHMQVVFVDDASDDGSARRLPLRDPRVRYLRNEVRLGGAGSAHRALSECCQPRDIVVHLDGDDWLACADALSHIDEQYRSHECWAMYGQFRWSTGEYGLCRPIASATDFGRLRESWVASHVKTYRAGLYHRIAEQDPGYACMKDARGCWLDAAVDVALMFPILELAGFERTLYNERVLYVYNAENAASVHRQRLARQTAVYEELQRRRRFVPVDSYMPEPAHSVHPDLSCAFGEPPLALDGALA